MQQRRDRVQWVYGAKNNRELEQRYDEWASEYDKDLREEFEWIAPRVTVALFGKYVAPDARVLDAGVGTGLVGECLIDAGYRQLHGIDLSVGMLDAACPGQVFTSPTPDQMLAAAQAVDRGAGTLFIVKNYSGDVMNFEMAVERSLIYI